MKNLTLANSVNFYNKRFNSDDNPIYTMLDAIIFNYLYDSVLIDVRNLILREVTYKVEDLVLYYIHASTYNYCYNFIIETSKNER